MTPVNNPIVTFLAKPPKPGMENGGADIDHKALSNITQKLRGIGDSRVTPDENTRKNPPAHMLVEVSNVADDIIGWLNAYFPDNDEGVLQEQRLRVQIVGHATSGSLSLGASWMDVAQWYEAPFPIFDTNPRLMVLLGQFVGCIQEVMLAGCQVASWRSNGYEVNGRTLLFTLAELWKCKVRGAANFVDADAFDAYGWYADDPVGWAWMSDSAGSRAEPAPADKAQRRQLLQGDGIARPSGVTAYGKRIEDPKYLDSIQAYFNTRLAPNNVPHLALPELKLELQFGDGASTPAALLCGGQFLMTGIGQDRVFYAHNDAPVGDASSARSEAITQALGAASVRPISRFVSRLAQCREAAKTPAV